MRVRFAPSPTGQLHVGNARTALFNWLLARGHGGTFILRIEDTDVERSTADADAAFEDAVRGEVKFHTDVIGDPVIVRADGYPSYNFAVVVDDALMEVTYVVRGEDHTSNTPKQVLMYEALGFTLPRFAHLALVLGPDHTPLSKRHGATSVSEFRAKGYLPEALVNYLALIGWSPRAAAGGRSAGDEPELLPIDELARRFSLERVGHSAGVFDEEKLAWVNRHYLKIADPRRIAALSLPYFNSAGVRVAPSPRGLEFLASAMAMVTASVDRLDQIPARVAFLFDYDAAAALRDARVHQEMTEAGPRAVVRALAEVLAKAPRLDRQQFRAVADEVKTRTGLKARALFHPIRVALTGRAEGPELDLAIPTIDRGADLPPDAGVPKVLGCRERAAAFDRALATTIDPATTEPTEKR